MLPRQRHPLNARLDSASEVFDTDNQISLVIFIDNDVLVLFVSPKCFMNMPNNT